MESLIKNWLLAQSIDVESPSYDKVGWAVDELFNLVHDNPDKLLSIITSILEVDSSHKTLGAIGAGPLEDLIVHQGDLYINKIIELVQINENFKAALRFTYIDTGDVSGDVYGKFQSLKASIVD